MFVASSFIVSSLLSYELLAVLDVQTAFLRVCNADAWKDGLVV